MLRSSSDRSSSGNKNRSFERSRFKFQNWPDAVSRPAIFLFYRSITWQCHRARGKFSGDLQICCDLGKRASYRLSIVYIGGTRLTRISSHARKLILSSYPSAQHASQEEDFWKGVQRRKPHQYQRQCQQQPGDARKVVRSQQEGCA